MKTIDIYLKKVYPAEILRSHEEVENLDKAIEYARWAVEKGDFDNSMVEVDGVAVWSKNGAFWPIPFEDVIFIDYFLHLEFLHREHNLGVLEGKGVGDSVCYSYAAPGTGYVTYTITRIEENGEAIGIVKEDTGRILTPEEVE